MTCVNDKMIELPHPTLPVGYLAEEKVIPADLLLVAGAAITTEVGGAVQPQPRLESILFQKVDTEKG